MFGLDDAIIGSAVIGAGASLLGAHKSASSAESVNAAQLAFARESAQNKYQWAVKDMEKAGLNPKLAGTQMSSVSGAQVPNLKNPGDAWAVAGNAISNMIPSAASALAALRNAEVNKANQVVNDRESMNKWMTGEYERRLLGEQAQLVASQRRWYDRLTNDAPYQRALWTANKGMYDSQARYNSALAYSEPYRANVYKRQSQLLGRQIDLTPFEQERLQTLSAKNRAEVDLYDRQQDKMLSEMDLLRAQRDKAYSDRDLNRARELNQQIDTKYKELIYGRDYWKFHDTGEFYRKNRWKIPFDEYTDSAQKVMDLIDTTTDQVSKFIGKGGSGKTFNINIKK